MQPSVTYRHEKRVDTVDLPTCVHLVDSFVSLSRRFIGGVYGRIIGVALVDLHGGVPTDRFWEWIDPGALALIGAASFFGGVSRLTMSLTVIMVRIQHHFNTLTAAIVYTASAQPARHGNTSHPKKLCKLRGRV